MAQTISEQLKVATDKIAELTQQLESLKSQNGANLANAAAAEVKQAELTKALADEKKAHAQSVEDLTATVLEDAKTIEALKASQTDFDKKLADAAALKAADIVASQAVPPVPQKPAADHPANGKPISGLTGRARTIAAFQKQLDSKK